MQFKLLFTFIESLLILSVFIQNNAYAQYDATFINPGLKFSHTFGDHGGLTVGGEISIIWMTEHNARGVFISLDECKSAERFKMQIGVEGYALPVTTFPAGLALGPSFVWEKRDVRCGLNATAFTGIAIIPYFSSTFFLMGSHLFELGAYGKLPIPLSGSHDIFKQ